MFSIEIAGNDDLGAVVKCSNIVVEMADLIVPPPARGMADFTGQPCNVLVDDLAPQSNCAVT